MSSVSIQAVSRTFEGRKGQRTQALVPVDFDVRDNDFVTILGPSGCGKSTLLRIVAGLDEPTVESAVRVAVEAQLLVVDRNTDAYRFRHALIGEVVYADLLPSQRNRLHRRVADALCEQPNDVLSRPDRAGELAFHLDRAGDREAAFAALLSAADAAEEIAPATALAHLERSFELWDSVTTTLPGEQRSHRLWQDVAGVRAGASGRAFWLLGAVHPGGAAVR